MWIAEAEGVPREEYATEDEALRRAQVIALKGKRAVVWERNDERGDA